MAVGLVGGQDLADPLEVIRFPDIADGLEADIGVLAQLEDGIHKHLALGAGADDTDVQDILLGGRCGALAEGVGRQEQPRPDGGGRLEKIPSVDLRFHTVCVSHNQIFLTLIFRYEMGVP